MRVPTTLLTIAFLAACGGAEDSAPADEMPTAEAPTMAAFVGTWALTATIEGTPDPVPVGVTGTADGAFTMTLPDREPMAVQVSMSGDSLVMMVPEYESVIRDGVMVSTRSAVVVDGDQMMGTLTATYRTPEGEEVVPGTITGSRSGM
jgi:hypothetical protein